MFYVKLKTLSHQIRSGYCMFNMLICICCMNTSFISDKFFNSKHKFQLRQVFQFQAGCRILLPPGSVDLFSEKLLVFQQFRFWKWCNGNVKCVYETLSYRYEIAKCLWVCFYPLVLSCATFTHLCAGNIRFRSSKNK